MRVLIISSHFSPEPVIGALRPQALARFLASRGHEVVVVTKSSPWGTGAHEPYTVVRTPWIRLPVFRYVRGRQDAASQHTPATMSPSHQDRSSPLRRLVAKWAHEMFSLPDTEGGWIPFGYDQAKDTVRSGGTFDVIVSSAPSFSSHVVAARLSRRFAIPWVADYRDLWTSGAYYPFGAVRRRIDHWVERKLLSSASSATVTSEGLKRDLGADFAIPIQVVLNGADEIEVTPHTVREPLSSAKVNLLYVGNNFYGERRSPAPLFRAAHELGVAVNDLRFHFLGSNPRVVERFATEAGVNHLVEVHEPVGHQESLEWQARADALLLLLWNDPREHGTVPGKLFEYVGVRRPIVSVGYTSGAAAELVQEHELGWCVADDQQAFRVLQELLSRKTTAALGADLPKSEVLSRECQCLKFESVLAEVVVRKSDIEISR